MNKRKLIVLAVLLVLILGAGIFFIKQKFSADTIGGQTLTYSMSTADIVKNFTATSKSNAKMDSVKGMVANFSAATAATTISTPNVWVNNFGGNTVSKIDATTGNKIGDYATGANSSGVAVDTNGFVWVVNQTSNTVSKINATTGAKVGDYTTGTSPQGVAIDANGFVWVVNAFGNTVSKINATTGAKVGDYATGSWPQGVAVDTNGFVWVINNGSNTVSKINATTGAKVGDYATVSRSGGVAADANGFVWITNYYSNTVSKFNAATGVKVGDYTTGSNSMGVAVDANGFVWVTNGGSKTVSKINPTTGAKVGDYTTGSNSMGVAVDANGFVWVTNYGDNNVSKINAVTGAKVADYATGTSPSGVATGFALQKFVLKRTMPVVQAATFSSKNYIDSGVENASWQKITAPISTVNVPVGVRVKVTFFASNDLNNLMMNEPVTDTFVGAKNMPLEIDLRRFGQSDLSGRYLNMIFEITPPDNGPAAAFKINQLNFSYNVPVDSQSVKQDIPFDSGTWFDKDNNSFTISRAVNYTKSDRKMTVTKNLNSDPILLTIEGPIKQMYLDKQGNLWIRANGKNRINYDSQTGELLTVDTFEDSEFLYLVNISDMKVVQKYEFTGAEINADLVDFRPDNAGGVVFYSDKGIFKFSSKDLSVGTISQTAHFNFPPDTVLAGITTDNHDKIWVSYYNTNKGKSGAIEVNSDTFIGKYTPKFIISGIDEKCQISFDSLGNLWKLTTHQESSLVDKDKNTLMLYKFSAGTDKVDSDNFGKTDDLNWTNFQIDKNDNIGLLLANKPKYEFYVVNIIGASFGIQTNIIADTNYGHIFAMDDSDNIYVVVNGTADAVFMYTAGSLVGAYSPREGNPIIDIVSDVNGGIHIVTAQIVPGKELVSTNGYLVAMQSLDKTNFKNMGSYDVAIDSKDNVWVASTYTNQIEKISQTGVIFGPFSSGGKSPHGIAIDSADNIWVANETSKSVVKFDNDGKILATKIVNGGSPYAVAVDGFGFVWVSIYAGGNISVLDNSGKNVVSKIRVPEQPGSIIFDKKQNRIWYTDYIAGTLCYINASKNTGIYLPEDSKCFSMPNQKDASAAGLTVDSNGDIFVAQNYSGRVYKFDSVAQTFLSIQTPLKNGTAQPVIDKLGNLWVSNFIPVAGKSSIYMYSNDLVKKLLATPINDQISKPVIATAEFAKGDKVYGMATNLTGETIWAASNTRNIIYRINAADQTFKEILLK